jgi:hypothetical protein
MRAFNFEAEDARLSASDGEDYWGDGCRPMPTYRNAMLALKKPLRGSSFQR